METSVVGDPGCSFLEVCSALLENQSPTNHLNTSIEFHTIIDLARELKVQSDVIERMRLDKTMFRVSNSESLHTLLANWRSRFSSRATLQTLVTALRRLELTGKAEIMERIFLSKNFTNEPKLKLYTNPPAGLDEFLISEKRLLILCTRDKAITEKWVRDSIATPALYITSENLSMKELHWKKRNELVVITCSENVKNLLTKLHGVEEKMVVIVEGNYKDVKKETFGIEWVISTQSNLKWADLTESFRQELKHREVRLQEHLVTFGDVVDLLPEHKNSEFREELIINLINHHEITLLSNMTPPLINYYVSRTLATRKMLRSAEIFNKGGNHNDIFFFTGIQRHELTTKAYPNGTDKSTNQKDLPEPTVRFITLDMKSDFDNISKKMKMRHLHWIHHENDKFLWTRSVGRMNSIQKAVGPPKTQVTFPEKDFLDEVNKTLLFETSVCISDTPGMGKSLLLINLSKVLALKYPSRIIQFTDFAELIFSVNRKLEEGQDLLDSIFKFLANLTAAEELGVPFVIEAMKRGKLGFEVMLDGFDEVPADDKELAIKCLNIIKSLPSTRVWVTTRPHLLHDMENCLQVLGHNIRPFNAKEQQQFLVTFWSEKNAESRKISTERLAAFANTCLDSLKKSMSSRDNDIAGIPLQCMLIATVLESDAINYADLENNTSSSEATHIIPPIRFRSITELFQRMIETKIRKYYERYANKTVIKRQELIDAHILLSLQLLFPHQAKMFQNMLNVDPHSILEDLLNVGLLLEISPDGIPRFIHRTVAEFFAAFFANRIIQEDSKDHFLSAEVDNLFYLLLDFNRISDIIEEEHVSNYDFKYPVICYFLNSLVQPSPTKLSTSSLTNFKLIYCSITQNLPGLFNFFITKTNLDESSQKFVFDQNLLLIAVKHSDVNMISQVSEFYEKLNNCKIRDLQFSNMSQRFTLLHVAVKYREYSVVEHMVTKQGFREQLIAKNHNCCTGLLQFCVEYSTHDSETLVSEKTQVLRLLVQLNRSLLENQSERYPQPLLCDRVTLPLLIELIKLGANFSARDKWGNNVLHTSIGSNPIKYNQLLTVITPFEIFTKLAKERNNHDEGATPLEAILARFDPQPETLQLFGNAGVIRDLKDTLLFHAIGLDRSVATLSELVTLGANFKSDCYAPWTLLHNALIRGKFLTFRYIALLTVNDRSRRNLLLKSSGWAELNNMDCRTLDIDWRVCPTGYASNLQYVLQSTEILHKFDIANILINAESKLDSLDFNEFRNFDVKLLTLLEQHGAINSLEKAYKSLEIMEETNLESFEVFLTKLLSTWGNKSLLEHTDPGGNTLLHHAANKGNHAAIQSLLKHGSNANQLNNENQSPLQSGFRRSSPGPRFLELLSVFDDYDAINSLDMAFHTFAFAASKVTLSDLESFAAVCDSIIQKWGERALFEEVVDKRGDSLLHILSQVSSELSIKYLQQVNNVNFNVRNKNNGETPLHSAVHLDRRRKTPEVVSLLIKKGVKLTLRNNRNETPLHIAIALNRWKTIPHLLATHEFDQIAPELVECAAKRAGLNILKLIYTWYTTTTFTGQANFETCLLRSAEADNYDNFEFLVDKRKDLLFSKSLENIVHGLVEQTYDRGVRHRIVILKIIAMRNKSLLEKRDEKGRPPFLVKKIDKKLLNWMLEHVSDPRAVDSCKRNVAYLSASYMGSIGYSELVEHLVKLGCGDLLKERGGESNSTVLHQAVLNLKVRDKTLSLFAQNGADFNAEDNDGNTVLMYAVKRPANGQDILSKLIEFGASWNVVNNSGATVLHEACSSGNLEAVAVFVNRCDVNAQDKDGNTPLHLVAKSGVGSTTQCQIIEVLLLEGACPTIRNANGLQPYNVAVEVDAEFPVANLLKPPWRYCVLL